ncbi:FusB/FusC family EF-G-binding protein [Paenibacillus sp. 1001270B_150601_E10]|uniref:FusB/FusC family EF-G-binding protein n=1 Tax=Paenibacillus sp. 1001270B_150601_E10 TaxID=2787079 RepID=UPI0018A119FF|nr:FusB/FusC family EF-G-binding protein [Paenibacillus sp. 1001270B_150601_E10]
MTTPFIRNHQYNFIKKQSNQVLHALRTVSDQRVLDTVRYRAAISIMEAFDDLTEYQERLLEPISTLATAYDFERYAASLEPYLEPYPPITPKQIQKLFPKTKKLKAPDLKTLDFRYITYLSWIDIASNRLFLIYPFEGQFVGLEGRITPTNKKGYCLFCNRQQELAFFSVMTKIGSTSPDHYSSVGQYICLENHVCNQNMTNTEALEKFILSARK